jgi:hypothetical protein
MEHEVLKPRPAVYLSGLGCCGIREMSGLYTSVDQEKEAAMVLAENMYNTNSHDYYGQNFRYIVFSEASGRYGERFADFLHREGLTDLGLVSTGRNVNPNSGNEVRVWIWTVDHEVFKKWWEVHGGKVSKREKNQGVPTVQRPVQYVIARDYIPPPVVQAAPQAGPSDAYYEAARGLNRIIEGNSF